MKLLQTKEPKNNNFTLALIFKNWHFVLPVDGTCVPKHVGAPHLMFVLIKDVHLVGVINGVCRNKNAQNGQLYKTSTSCTHRRL